MSYEKCLEFAGAKVLASEYFGSYEGEWYAKVDYHGEVFWVNGSFGSCSGCDAFLSEFDMYNYHEYNGKEEYHNVFYTGFHSDCDECNKILNRVIAFGQSYLDNKLTQAEVEKMCAKNIEWDMEAADMIKFVKENSIEEHGICL